MNQTVLPSVENDASVISQDMLDELSFYKSKTLTINNHDLQHLY